MILTKSHLVLMSLSLMIASAKGGNVDRAGPVRAGAAKVDITPPKGIPMWGYGARHDDASVGTLDPLYARAVVIAVKTKKIAVVSLDLGRAPTRKMMSTIRKDVKEKTGIENLFLVGSHTHHGPVIEVEDWPNKKKPYVRELEQKLIDVILGADKQLQPARLKVASKQIPYNRNRHSKLPNPPVDRELLVMSIESNTGKSIATLVNFAAHPTMYPAKLYKFSADWPGAMAKMVEKKTGAPCLFLQGASGDLSANPGKLRGPEALGEAIATEVIQLIESKAMKPVDASSLEVQEEDFKFQSRIDFGNVFVRLAFERAFFPELVAFYEREYREGIRPHLTTALLGERIGFVGVSGEFFCTHSLRLKERARLDHVFFLGYCNDYQQYFPTIEAAGEGGYGADAQVSPVEVGAGEQIMNRALIHLYKMRGKLQSMKPPK